MQAKAIKIDFTNEDQSIKGQLLLICKQEQKSEQKPPCYKFYKQIKIKKWLQLDSGEIKGFNQLIRTYPNLVEKFANQSGSEFNHWDFMIENHYLTTPFNYASFKPVATIDFKYQVVNLATFLKFVPLATYWFYQNKIAYHKRIDYQWDFTSDYFINLKDQDLQYWRQGYRQEVFKLFAEQNQNEQKLESAHIINFKKLIDCHNYHDAINPYNCLQLPKQIHQQWDLLQLVLYPDGTFVNEYQNVVYQIDLTTVAKPTWQYLKLYWKSRNIKQVRTRYAPSPTGSFHIGGARCALFNYLFAKHYRGQMLFRLEDTDLNRNLQNGEQVQMLGCKWLGIEFDEAPWIEGCNQYRQSERLTIYQDYAKQLIAKGFANQDPDSQTVIFKNDPNRNWSWNDLVRHQISFKGQSLRDWIIIKSNGYPTYNFAVAIDDHLMEISHVFRGEEHISNTPYQLMIYDAFDWEAPQFGHLNLIINDEGKKLSKRDLNAQAQLINYYQINGYEPGAIVNFLLTLGWTSTNGQEIYDLATLKQVFDGKRLVSAPARFDQSKLNWFAKHYFQKVKIKTLVKKLTWSELVASEQKAQLVKAFQKESSHLNALNGKINAYVANWKIIPTKVDWKEHDVQLLEQLMLLSQQSFKISTFNKWLKQIPKQKWKTIRMMTTGVSKGPELAVAMWLETPKRWKIRFPMLKFKL